MNTFYATLAYYGETKHINTVVAENMVDAIRETLAHHQNTIQSDSCVVNGTIFIQNENGWEDTGETSPFIEPFSVAIWAASDIVPIGKPQEITRIAIIEDGFARDAMLFTEDPAMLDDEDSGWEDHYTEVSYTVLYVGVFTGPNEDDIKRQAAETEGVHPDIITLIAT